VEHDETSVRPVSGVRPRVEVEDDEALDGLDIRVHGLALVGGRSGGIAMALSVELVVDHAGEREEGVSAEGQRVADEIEGGGGGTGESTLAGRHLFAPQSSDKPSGTLTPQPDVATEAALQFSPAPLSDEGNQAAVASRRVRRARLIGRSQIDQGAAAIAGDQAASDAATTER
jgi:hypothetical protein